jgi:exodeoxyribonuclease-3
LCLQEINGWQDTDFARLKDFSDRTGYTEYEYGNSNSEYKLVTLSMAPITKRTVHVEGFWHCVIETHIDFEGMEIVILNLHLDPWKEDPRLREVGRLMELIDTKKPTVIMGDFNGLSRQDKYPPEFLQELQKHQITKYGQDALDFRVADFMKGAGFIDVAAHLGQLDTTVPTPFNTDEAHEVPARVDYAYVSASLVPFIRDYTVLKNEETNKISDHYPIILTLGSEKEQPPTTSTTEVDPDTEPMLKAQQPEPTNSPTEGEIRLH